MAPAANAMKCGLSFAYFHRWRPGDLLVWDNWRTMHLATGHKKKHACLMHRTTLRGAVALGA